MFIFISDTVCALVTSQYKSNNSIQLQTMPGKRRWLEGLHLNMSPWQKTVGLLTFDVLTAALLSTQCLSSQLNHNQN